jgi:hypothetical protein
VVATLATGSRAGTVGLPDGTALAVSADDATGTVEGLGVTVTSCETGAAAGARSVQAVRVMAAGIRIEVRVQRVMVMCLLV